MTDKKHFPWWFQLSHRGSRTESSPRKDTATQVVFAFVIKPEGSPRVLNGHDAC